MARYLSSKPLIAATGAFLAFGMAPLAAPPSAQADPISELFEQMLAPFVDAAAGTAPALAPVDPTEWFQEFIYTPLHTGIEGWINSDLGRQVDDVINKVLGSYVIGDGTPGTEENPTGGAAGWLFGDGGTGWTSTESGVAGGAGGAAGAFGNGGVGGDGGEGAAGGDGGAGGSWFGVGGVGGDAGDGPGLHGLPALGGAGGTAGMFGVHGTVGHFGTLDGAAPSGTPNFSNAGGWITDSTGRVVILHGTNVLQMVPWGDPTPNLLNVDPSTTPGIADYLAAHGFNAVRLAIQWSSLEPEPGVFDDVYIAQIGDTVKTLGERGIATLIDMNQGLYADGLGFGASGAPEWAVQTDGAPNIDGGYPGSYVFNPVQYPVWDAFWSNAAGPGGIGLQNHYALMYEYLANSLKDSPYVYGYEIMNEPWPGSQWLGALFGNPHFDAQMLTPFYNQVTSAIRAVDPTTPVFFEPNVLFGNLPVPTHLGTVDDPNTVFSFHPYCTPGVLAGNIDFGCSAYADLIQDFADAYTKPHGIPSLITEFGNTYNNDILNATMDSANENRIGWQHWDYDWLVSNLNEPPSDDNIHAGLLTTLTQPYPQAISGTPLSWSFNDGTFQLSYSTEMAGGSEHFVAGSQTTISTPVSQFPDGYDVKVTGGHVVSPADAPVLVVESDGGATTVNVTVSPAR